MIVHTVMAPL